MSEIDEKGFLGGKLETVQRSNAYWTNMNIIQAVLNANSFTHFWIDRAGELQGLLRAKAPKVVGDWFRYQCEQFTVTFSFSDDSIRQLQPTVREFSSFGAAVKILGCYESYLLEIIRNTIIRFPEKVCDFSRTHCTGNVRTHKGKNFMWKKLGRGIIFLEEIFAHSFHPSYAPCMNFFFELRNVAVHNANIADEALCQLSKSEFINITGQINCGDRMEWSLISLLQLNQFVSQILDEVDALVCSLLMLETIPGRAHWYYAEGMGDKLKDHN
jgi:hypothetical protein